jgi:hypothetical protein
MPLSIPHGLEMAVAPPGIGTALRLPLGIDAGGEALIPSQMFAGGSVAPVMAKVHPWASGGINNFLLLVRRNDLRRIWI